MSPEKRPTKHFGRFNGGIRSLCGYFCRVENKRHWKNLPNDTIRITGFQLANFVLLENLLGMNSLGERRMSCYFFIGKFLKLGSSWCETRHRCWRGFLCVGWRLKTGTCEFGCFHSGWSHSALRRKQKTWGLINSSNKSVHQDRVVVRDSFRFI